jgi:hypothetical protein
MKICKLTEWIVGVVRYTFLSRLFYVLRILHKSYAFHLENILLILLNILLCTNTLLL